MFDQHKKPRVTWRRIGLPLWTALSLAACEAHVGNGPTAPYGTEAPDATGQSSSPWGNRAGDAADATNDAEADASVPGASSNPAASNQRAQMQPSAAGSAARMPMAMMDSMCDEAPAAAQHVLSMYCSSCHGNIANPKAGFGTVGDVPAMLTSGKVIAFKPDTSPLYRRLASDSMPPAGVMLRPDAADIAAVELWISCGAQDWNAVAAKDSEFVDIDKRLRWVLDDLLTFANPSDRERMRYIDVSTLANGGASADELVTYREAVSMLVNSLSRGRSVVAPEAIDAASLIFRIDLRDYLWDQETWRQLEEQYPYAVIYDRDSRLFPFDEVTAEQIRLETDTQIPVIQADWFISHTSRPPLYYSLLALPDTLGGLEQQLGVDVDFNIESQQVMRSGFANAGPSQNNRVIERHELGGNRGALWLSYDFSNNLDDRNIFANPLDFQEDGGEMIFNLDNGLQGYFIADAAGRRLDKAPNNVVQDPAARDGAVEAGLSCMNCHQVDGQLPKLDEIRDFQLNAGASADEIEEVLALYVPASELQAAFDEDQNRYRGARSALGIANLTNTTFHQLDDKHLGVIDINGVASVVGLPAEELKRAIDASPQAFPPEIVTLRTRGGGIQRDSFEAGFDQLILALGLGRQLRVGSQGQTSQAPSSPEPSGSSDAGVADAGASSSSGGSSRR